MIASKDLVECHEKISDGFLGRLVMPKTDLDSDLT